MSNYSEDRQKLYFARVAKHFHGEEESLVGIIFDKGNLPVLEYEDRKVPLNWLPVHYGVLRNPEDPDRITYKSPPKINTIVMIKQTEISLAYRDYKERGGKKRLEEALEEEALEMINGNKNDLTRK